VLFRSLSTENEKLPIISGCQVNRTGIGSSNLDFTDVADSIGVATESDLIIGITQTEEQKDLGGKSVYSWSILKNRFGVDGLRCTVGVDKYHMKIYPVEQPKKEEKPTEEQKVNKASETIINNIKDEKKEIQKKIIRFDEDDTDKTS
jgi:hypothetical protein